MAAPFCWWNFLIALAFGVPLVVAELAIGKRGAADAVTAFEVLAPHSVWRHADWPGVVGAGPILGYLGCGTVR